MLSDEQLKDYETKYPGCIRVQGSGKPPEWEVVVRRPTRPEFKRYRSRREDPRWRADAVEELITSAVVYPDQAAFQELLEKYPAACEGISQVEGVADMLGLSATQAGK